MAIKTEQVMGGRSAKEATPGQHWSQMFKAAGENQVVTDEAVNVLDLVNMGLADFTNDDDWLGRWVTSLSSHVWMRVLKLEAHLLTPAIEATRDEAKHHFLKYDSFILWAWR